MQVNNIAILLTGLSRSRWLNSKRSHAVMPSNWQLVFRPDNSDATNNKDVQGVAVFRNDAGIGRSD